MQTNKDKDFRCLHYHLGWVLGWVLIPLLAEWITRKGHFLTLVHYFSSLKLPLLVLSPSQGLLWLGVAWVPSFAGPLLRFVAVIHFVFRARESHTTDRCLQAQKVFNASVIIEFQMWRNSLGRVMISDSLSLMAWSDIFWRIFHYVSESVSRVRTTPWICGSQSWGPFLEGPEKFSHPKSRRKISNLMITERFFPPILNTNRVPFIQEVSGVYTSMSLNTD